MGATASLMTALPEAMDSQQLQSICQERYSQALFDENCDDNKLVSRERFIELVAKQQENEVKELYLQFCLTRKNKKTDLITCEQLLGLCVHCKIFNKAKFNSQDCADEFVKLISEENKDHVTSEIVMDSNSSIKKIVTIDFFLFKNQLLPIIAERKGVDLDKLIFKLSRCEAATIQVGGNYVVDDDYNPENMEEPSVNVYVQALAHKVRMRKKAAGTGNNFKRRSDMSDAEAIKENTAAANIQTQERTRQARKVVLTLRKINYDSYHADAEKDFDNMTYSDSLEESFKEKFLHYSNNCKEMDWKRFVTMCGECGLFGQKFTRLDAQNAFNLGMARGK